MSKVSKNRESITISVTIAVKKHIKNNKIINFSRWVCERYSEEFMKEENIHSLKDKITKLQGEIEPTTEDITWAKDYKGKLGGDKITAQHDAYCNSIKVVSFDDFKILIKKLHKVT